MQIVDAHHHLWDLETNIYPWLADGDHDHAPVLQIDEAGAGGLLVGDEDDAGGAERWLLRGGRGAGGQGKCEGEGQTGMASHRAVRPQ